MKIGILALQGAFAEHEKVLENLGVCSKELRCRKDLDDSFSGFIFPGGESTVQGKLLKDLDMLSPLKEKIEAGVPVLATCAGLILLAGKIEDEPVSYFGTIPMTVRRNAYGRQLGSFYTEDEVRGIGTVPMTFIRAPYITQTGPDVEILSAVKGNIVGVRYKHQLAFSFHPELDKDLRIHREFLKMAEDFSKDQPKAPEAVLKFSV